MKYTANKYCIEYNHKIEKNKYLLAKVGTCVESINKLLLSCYYSDGNGNSDNFLFKGRLKYNTCSQHIWTYVYYMMIKVLFKLYFNATTTT